jgi:polyhydroxyalkanoate synthesis regulator phasin
MQEALRTYLELAMGLTEVSRKKVKRAVKGAVGKSGATADQLKALSADLLAANSANREALSKLVKFEVDRALGVVGLATAEEVAELNRRVHDLEGELAAAKGEAEPAHTVPAESAKSKAPGKKAAKKTAEAAVPAEGGAARSPARKTPRSTPAESAPAKSTGKKTTPAKRTAAKTSPAKSAPAKTTSKTTARKAARKAARKSQP